MPKLQQCQYHLGTESAQIVLGGGCPQLQTFKRQSWLCIATDNMPFKQAHTVRKSSLRGPMASRHIHHPWRAPWWERLCKCCRAECAQSKTVYRNARKELNQISIISNNMQICVPQRLHSHLVYINYQYLHEAFFMCEQIFSSWIKCKSWVSICRDSRGGQPLAKLVDVTPPSH